VYLRIFGLTGRLKAIIVVLKPRETVKSNKDIVTYKIVVLRWAYLIQKISEEAVGSNPEISDLFFLAFCLSDSLAALSLA
jgi:hypothetical protein